MHEAVMHTEPDEYGDFFAMEAAVLETEVDYEVAKMQRESAQSKEEPPAVEIKESKAKKESDMGAHANVTESKKAKNELAGEDPVSSSGAVNPADPLK